MNLIKFPIVQASLFTCCAFGQNLDLDNPQEIIRQLVAGNYEQTCELSVLKLFQLDSDFFEGLSREVCNLVSICPLKKLTLLNRTGKFQDASSDHDWSVWGKKFFHARRYPHLGYLISLFPHAVNFRAVRMGPLSQLYPHDENICLQHRKTGEPCLRVRFHLPIKTHPEAFMFMDGEFYRFEEGNIYFFHNGRIHDAMNQHPSEERIHLIWDMLLTDDTFRRMFERSIPMPKLARVENVYLLPVKTGEIDLHALKRPRIFDYDEALRSSLCPIQ